MNETDQQQETQGKTANHIINKDEKTIDNIEFTKPSKTGLPSMGHGGRGHKIP